MFEGKQITSLNEIAENMIENVNTVEIKRVDEKHRKIIVFRIADLNFAAEVTCLMIFN